MASGQASPIPTSMASAGVRSLNRVGFGVLACVISGCAMLKPLPPEESVRQRAMQRWTALKDGRFDEALSYHVSAMRGSLKPGQYESNFANRSNWLKIEVVKVDCGPQLCDVRVALTAKTFVPGMFNGTIDTAINEKWVFAEGQWLLNSQF